MARQVNVVPHTHWDREWYKPYPLFRMQLVELVDLLLDQLDADPGYVHFQLDGQMAVVDDYLEIRPERREALERLAAEGRVTMGPWYTLPDEFLVSGETHVRNLALGLAKAEAFGAPMTIGYLPDMFGHVAQMPQVLAGFGFTDAVVWRGVPAAITEPAFDWEAPDGSRVRTEYLSDGYSNGARLPETGAELVAQLDAFVAAQGSLVGDPVLWMNGTDHQLPQARLTRVLAEANEVDPERYRFAHTSLAEHLAQGARDGLQLWRGELRSGARTNVLMGTASCRVDVKQAAARVERRLERIAEPLVALWPPAEGHPGAFFDHAWRDVIRNAAHDSICGCSADEVNDAVLHRYAESTRIAEALAERALIRILGGSGQPAVVVNPTARPRAATVTAVLAGDVPPPDTQQLSVRPARQRLETIGREAAYPVVTRAVLEDPKVSRYELHRDGAEVVVVLHADRSPKAVDEQALRDEVRAVAADEGVERVHLEVQRVDASQEVLLRTGEIPGFGWRGLAPADLGEHAVRAEGTGLTNGLVTVEVDKADGTFSLNGVAGYGRLVDDGDEGDTYNWSPPAEDVVVQRPDHVEATVAEAGPVRGRLEIVRTYRLPRRVEDHRRVGEVVTEVRTTVEVHAGEDLVRVHVELDNRSEDHRLRIHLPLPEPAAGSEAECAFGTVARGLDAEGGPNEAALPTFPSRRFVSAGGLTVAHDGLTEYELVDLHGEGDERRARELALTVIRCVGLISSGPMAMRALPAGPPTPTPAAQMPGRHAVDLVLHVGGRDPYAVADEALVPVQPARLGGAAFGDLDATGVGLRVTGGEVSALRRRADGRLELRVFNPGDEPVEVTVADAAGEPVAGEATDLRGEPVGRAFGGTEVLAAHRIATWALDA